VSAERAELRVLSGFESTADQLAAVRASCSIPVVTGAPPLYRGEPMVDGGLLEAVPYRTALREGATHVLVLRTQPASYRGGRQSRFAERVLARAHPELAPLLHTCSQRYNRDAAALQAGQPGLTQVAVPAGSRLVSRFSTDRARIAGNVRLGALAMASSLYGERATEFWQPFPELLAA
jgi:predicted patatin/cPLA2 family phospholipase